MAAIFQAFGEGYGKRYKRRILLIAVTLIGLCAVDYWVLTNAVILFFVVRGPSWFKASVRYLRYLFQHKTPVGHKEVSVGRPLIGGEWELVNTEGKLEGSADLKGNWLLMYFGFTHCPDICPDELEKMTRVSYIITVMTTVTKVFIHIIALFAYLSTSSATSSRNKIQSFADY